MITKELIESRINKFLGYGNPESDVWFVGMEEGFDGTLTDLEARFRKTYGQIVIDLQDYSESIADHNKWFGDRSPIQRTRSKLILILLTLSSEKVIDNNAIKEYQRKKLARSNSNHCSIELMPLPCRSVNNKDWFYNQFKIDYLSSRKSYLRSVLPLRIKSIKEVITKYKPRIVIFYSFTYLKYREEVIGNKFIKLNRLYHYKQDDINYFIIPHPTAYGIEKQEWIDIAESIKALTV